MGLASGFIQAAFSVLKSGSTLNEHGTMPSPVAGLVCLGAQDGAAASLVVWALHEN